MRKKIFDAGVVGAGGAGFPAHVKYDTKAEIFIVNAIECEPLLRSDRYIVEQFAMQLVDTMILIGKELNASRIVIGVKEHNSGMVTALRAAIRETDVELYLSPSVYPAGDEQNLIYSITGRVVPTGGLPLDVGCVVSNVSTVYHISKALQGQPVTDRIVTVGGAVAFPVTLQVPIGTPMQELLAAAGGTTAACSYIIGGPLMGRVVTSLENETVTKTSGGLFAIPKDHRLLTAKNHNLAREIQQAKAVCCQCSMCTQLCPRGAMGLNVQPHKVMRAMANGKMELLGRDANGVFSCCDCGICTYFACNFGLHPSKMMQEYKKKLLNDGRRAVKEVRFEPKGFDSKRLPTERLLQRLDLKRFDKDAPFAGQIEPAMVCIPLKMHVGAPCVPVVKTGDFVQNGQLIAEPNGLGAKIHASITGQITAVNNEFIKIRR